MIGYHGDNGTFLVGTEQEADMRQKEEKGARKSIFVICQNSQKDKKTPKKRHSTREMREK